VNVAYRDQAEVSSSSSSKTDVYCSDVSTQLMLRRNQPLINP